MPATAIALAAGSNQSAWVRVSAKAKITIGKAADGWNSGTVSIYGRDVKADGSQVDADKFLIKTYNSTDTSKAEVLDISTSDQMEISFIGAATNVTVNCSYS